MNKLIRKIYAVEKAGYSKMLHMTATPMGTFQKLPLVLRNLPLHITAFFLSKMIFQIFQLIWYRIWSRFISGCLIWNFNFIKSYASHIYILFHQMISLDDTVLH